MTQMKGPDGVYYSAAPEIVSATAKKIVCHWPEEFGEGYEHGRILVTVWRPKVEGDFEQGSCDREKYATVYPA